jgi:hypothetical protein
VENESGTGALQSKDASHQNFEIPQKGLKKHLKRVF